MSLRSRYLLNLAIWAIGFVGLLRGLIWIPLLYLTPVTWVSLGIGLLPLVILDRSFRPRYLCFCLLMSGVGGLLYLGGQYLNCVLGAGLCIHLPDHQKLKIAIPVYGLLATIGAFWFKALTSGSRAKRRERH